MRLKQVTICDITETPGQHPDKLTWAQYILYWRYSLGLSQAAAAKLLHVNRATVGTWEREANIPRVAAMRAHIETIRATL